MEQIVDDTVTSSNPKNKPTLIMGASFPVETIKSCIDTVKKIASHSGSGNFVSRKDVTIILGKSEGTVNLKLSTCVQYGLLLNKHGKGYLPSELFMQYIDPVYDEDRKKAMLQMFNQPALYAKIILALNSKILPNEDGFANLLKNEYGVNPNSSEKAAKIFFENAKMLDIVDNNNRLRVLPSLSGEEKSKDINLSGEAKNAGEENPSPPPPLPPPPPADDLFELPIPLGGKRKAYIRYPLDDLKKKDIKIIVKALAFIASSIEDENGDEFEIEIKEIKKGD